MLGKLLKHEFMATARIMWIFYAAVAALSVGAHLSIRFYNAVDIPILSALMTLTIIVWVVSLMAMLVGTLVIVIRRFYTNLLTDEGYLMFTLPVTAHHLVISKLIVGVVWFVASMVVVALGVAVATLDSQDLQDIFFGLRDIILKMNAYYAANGALMTIEILVVMVLAFASYTLQFYSAMSIGFGFNRHKGGMSVLFYFVEGYAMQLIGTLLVSLGFVGGFQDSLDFFFSSMTSIQNFHLVILAMLVMEIIMGAVFYVITILNLQKRLNLS